MTSPWPSDQPRARSSRGSGAGSKVPTDWLSVWLVFAAVAAAVVSLVGLAWPAMAQALEAFQTVTDALDRAGK